MGLEACSTALDYSALAGVIGALMGAGLGSYATYKVQERLLRHTDATRFHDRRLTIYSDFMATANQLMAEWQVGQLSSVDLHHANMVAFEQLRLVGGESVTKAAVEVSAHLHQALHGDQQQARQATVLPFSVAMAHLVRAMRSELGTRLPERAVKPENR
jgi:hypothetical protein